MARKGYHQHRLDSLSSPSLRNWQDVQGSHAAELSGRTVLEMGWGRLIFAHTFQSHERLIETLRQEAPGKRDIAIYLRDPHVILSLSPQELFLDPSHTYRLWLHLYKAPRRVPPRSYTIERITRPDDIAAMNRIFNQRNMVPVDPDVAWKHRNSQIVTYLVARESDGGAVVGTVTGVDHVNLFSDPEKGSSLWCLAVDPLTPHPGIGEALVRMLAEQFKARGREFMDLSVMHDNTEAIALYEKLGFERVPVFSIKKRNAFNEPLFTTSLELNRLNPYARIIVDEARQRGIGVEILDAEGGYFALTLGSRRIVCRESLTELTTAIALSRCDDKAVTRRLLEQSDLRVPNQTKAGSAEHNRRFLETHGLIVVKPARGEQGRGIAVRIQTEEAMEAAIEEALNHCETVLLEQYVEGQDLRIIVIDGQVAAAAIRLPPVLSGTGRHSVRQLLAKYNRRRRAATGGESSVPLDGETERCVREAGYGFDDVLPEGVQIRARHTANLHTGGTIQDVTAALNPELAQVAVRAAVAIEIPLVGMDLLVNDVTGTDYVVIEANERPGLANHEPQPTAQRFVNFLFPQTMGENHPHAKTETR
ncbi:MAG: N-acetylglutaminylglutamine synthetase [Leptospiraceae bacterium]|nr:N-acetylglutaminylglutamine synthetase [Leptospiraceae bacterium]